MYFKPPLLGRGLGRGLFEPILSGKLFLSGRLNLNQNSLKSGTAAYSGRIKIKRKSKIKNSGGEFPFKILHELSDAAGP